MFCRRAGGWGRCQQNEISMGGAVPSGARSHVQAQAPCKDEARRRRTAKGKPTLDTATAATHGTSMAAPVVSTGQGHTQVIGQSLPPLREIQSAGQAAWPSSRVERITLAPRGGSGGYRAPPPGSPLIAFLLDGRSDWFRTAFCLLAARFDAHNFQIFG